MIYGNIFTRQGFFIVSGSLLGFMVIPWSGLWFLSAASPQRGSGLKTQCGEVETPAWP